MTPANALATPKLSSTTSTPPGGSAIGAAGAAGAGFAFGLADTHTPFGRKRPLTFQGAIGRVCLAFSTPTTADFPTRIGPVICMRATGTIGPRIVVAMPGAGPQIVRLRDS